MKMGRPQNEALDSSPDIAEVIKFITLIWAGHIVRMEESRSN